MNATHHLGPKFIERVNLNPHRHVSVRKQWPVQISDLIYAFGVQ